MKILIINGPNINMLGIREPEIYGSVNYATLCDNIKRHCEANHIEYQIYQSNHEGCLIDKIQSAYFDRFDGIVINPGGYTHTSVAILDALKAVNIPTIEVHISDVTQREEFRKLSYVSIIAQKTIMGQGINGYIMAIDELVKNYNESYT